MDLNGKNFIEQGGISMEEKKEMQKKESKDISRDFGDKVKTTTRNMSDIIKEKLDHLKDLASLEIMMDVGSRMKHRLESIKNMSSASSIKIRGHWKTTAPRMHIMGLQGRKISNNECEINFSVYETDEKGDKKLHTNYADITLRDGSTINRPTSAEYRIAQEVVETIKNGKAITREIINVGQ